MNDFDTDQLEAELRAFRPAKPPRQVLETIQAQLSDQEPSGRNPNSRRASAFAVPLGRVLRWLIPAGAVAALALFILGHRDSRPKPAPVTVSTKPVLRADKIEINRQLLANFDAVARLPNGEPIRFRCEQWMDQVWVRDSSAGLVLQRTTPRLEIVPVSLETY